MPCDFITDEDGRVSLIICGPGRYRHLVMARCPWCCLGDDKTLHAFREVHSGYCAPDLVCGSCGYYWNGDMEREPRISEERRDENIEMVRAMQGAGITVSDPWPLPSILEMEER